MVEVRGRSWVIKYSKCPAQSMNTKTLVKIPLFKILLLLSLLPYFTSLATAQCTDGGETCSPGVPRLVKFGGVLKDLAGEHRTGTVAITFAVYSEADGGTPLWQETQNVQLDQQGRYTVLLGTTKIDGLPKELFSSGEPRWLGVQAQLPGETERARVLLVSVPYALEAANAQTLGGFPPSPFVKVAPTNSIQMTSESDGERLRVPRRRRL
jgi:trimeric autotransporter adhesin